jgi:uncharacterized membrane protein YfcA
MGAGGMCGSLLGAFITQYHHPKWAFLIYSVLGLVVMILGINLDQKAEQDD